MFNLMKLKELTFVCWIVVCKATVGTVAVGYRETRSKNDARMANMPGALLTCHDVSRPHCR